MVRHPHQARPLLPHPGARHVLHTMSQLSDGDSLRDRSKADQMKDRLVQYIKDTYPGISMERLKIPYVPLINYPCEHLLNDFLKVWSVPRVIYRADQECRMEIRLRSARSFKQMPQVLQLGLFNTQSLASFRVPITKLQIIFLYWHLGSWKLEKTNQLRVAKY
jgi:hypothetical protein